MALSVDTNVTGATLAPPPIVVRYGNRDCILRPCTKDNTRGNLYLITPTSGGGYTPSPPPNIEVGMNKFNHDYRSLAITIIMCCVTYLTMCCLGSSMKKVDSI